MSEKSEILAAAQAAGDAALLTSGEFDKAHEILGTVSHAIQTGTASLKQAQDGVQKIVHSVEQQPEGIETVSVDSAEDVLVTAQSALERAELAKTDAARLAAALESAHQGLQTFVDKVNALVEAAQK